MEFHQKTKIASLKFDKMVRSMQQTFSDIEYSNRKRKTKREELGEKLFADVRMQLEAAGLIIHGGTVV